MRRKLRRPDFEEPSLVPLADLLSNTVGIMVFIFIFTVIAAGGASVMKRLPFERSSDLDFITVFCQGDRVQPFDSGLIDRFVGASDGTLLLTEEWLEEFEERRLDDAMFRLSGEVSPFSLSVAVLPHAGAGDPVHELSRPGSRLHALLAKHKPNEHFVFFVVYPDAIEAFTEARAVALEAGYSTGWWPQEAGEPVRFVIFGSGTKPGTMTGGT